MKNELKDNYKILLFFQFHRLGEASYIDIKAVFHFSHKASFITACAARDYLRKFWMDNSDASIQAFRF